MRSKNTQLINQIIEYIDNCFFNEGNIPSIRKIASSLGVSKSCVSDYLSFMKENGLIDGDGGWHGIKTPNINKIKNDIKYVPLVGSIACGQPIFAEENIEEYVPLPSKIFGIGKHFILRAKGDSMINLGICDGDYVVVKQCNIAEQGQIIVALINDEATLKRYFIDKEKKQIRLHAENEKYQDMFFDNIIIQGVAVKVIKNIQ